MASGLAEEYAGQRVRTKVAFVQALPVKYREGWVLAGMVTADDSSGRLMCDNLTGASATVVAATASQAEQIVQHQYGSFEVVGTVKPGPSGLALLVLEVEDARALGECARQ